MKHRLTLLAAAVSCCVAPGCRFTVFGLAAAGPKAVPPGPRPPSRLQFEDVAQQVGLKFRWGQHLKHPLTNLDSFGWGCAFLDYDNDGWLDILLVSEPYCALFHNVSDGAGGRKFVDVSAAAGLQEARGPWKGCAVGDFDNDGYLDVLLTGYHQVGLLHNDAGRRFRDVTAVSKIQHRGWASSAGFADYSGDGKLDLFIGNYVKFGPDSVQHCRFQGAVMGGCPPQVYPPEYGQLYHNNGDGTVTNVTQPAGLARSSGKTLAIGWCDYDDDGDPDLYLANDGVPGNLYRNDGGHFTDVGILTGTAFGLNQLAQAGMGVDWADYNRDGRMDLLVTAFSNESYSLYRNGDGIFENVSAAVGIAEPTFAPLGFGCRFVDVDNDGWPDVVFANGHVYDQADKINPSSPFHQKLLLMRNEHGQRFTDVSAEAGAAFRKPIAARGLAAGDFDNDGRMDLLVVDLDGSPLLLRNVTRDSGSVLRLRLTGDAKKGNRFAYGARVRVYSAAGSQVADVTPVSSYLSSSDTRLYFGLGAATRTDHVSVRWPDGYRERFPAQAPDREVVLQEGRGEPDTSPAISSRAGRR